MSNAKFIGTMDEWMRDILRRVEKLERRRGRGGSGGGGVNCCQEAYEALQRTDDTISLAHFASLEQLNGTEDPTEPFQQCVNYLTDGGTIMVPPGSELWFNGDNWVKLDGKQNLRIRGNGSTIRKTQYTPSVPVFSARGAQLEGRVSSRNIIIEGFRVEGSFTDGAEASVTLLTGNHMVNTIVRDIEFFQANLQARHSIDMGGWDGVLIENCVWHGFKPSGETTPRTEAVNTDISVRGSGADVVGNLTGDVTKNVTMRNCRFLPWTDPDTGIKYPCPNPMGSHLAKQGEPFYNIEIENVIIVDPPVDTYNYSSAEQDNPTMRGLFHWPSIQGLRIQADVLCTDGEGQTTVVQAQSCSHGVLADTDPNVGGQGDFSPPDPAKDIVLDLGIYGNTSVNEEKNMRQVMIGGITGYEARDVHIRINSDGVFDGNVVALYKVERAHVECNISNGFSYGTGVLMSTCTQCTVTGNITNAQFPVRCRTGSTRISVGPLTLTSENLRTYVIQSEGSDYITAVGINAQGYERMFSDSTITNAVAGNLLVP